MCGVAGVLRRNGTPAERDEVAPMTRALAHRGPDGEGVWVDGPVGLGHRRLAILDLGASGAQPMRCLDGRVYLTFNGEIFNFLELRRELQRHGHVFRTDTDTEVIAHAYERWGRDCVRRFNGMWAFALWDVRRQHLLLSRDHFGIKPLFYVDRPDRFAFASELKAFLHLPGFTAREDQAAVRLALFNPGESERSDRTLLEDVRRLHGGHSMLVHRSGTEVWQWWRTLDHVPSVPPTWKGQVEEFRELFVDACRLRLRSDVPVATCVSGGLDSSSVLCTVAELAADRTNTFATQRRTPDAHRAFVATFPDTPKDERRHAELAIARAQADPRFCPMSAPVDEEELRRFAYDFEGVGGSLMLPLWRTYRAVRDDGVAVSLDGHGGDELLAGYAHYVQACLGRIDPLRHPFRGADMARTLAPLDGSAVSTTGARLLLQQLHRSHALPGVRWMRGRDSPSLRSPNWRGQEPTPVGEMSVDPAERAAMELLGPLDQELYAAVHLHHLPHILRNFDRCSMSHGVEIRMPFLDPRLVAYSFGLPASAKLGGGFTKRILREAMRGTVPESLRRRRDKIGFSPPLGDWFTRGLGGFVLDQVCSPAFLECPVWDGPAIRDFVVARQREVRWSTPDCERVWPFIQTHLWRQAFFAEHRPPLVLSQSGMGG
jgi:asparagine synthase (glutamine-hydrolysing)